jgi:long-chain acyl-CoA synthetase
MKLAQQIQARLDLDPQAIAVESHGAEYSWAHLARVYRAVDDALTRAGLGAGAPVGFVGRSNVTTLGAVLGLLGSERSIIAIHPLQSAESMARELAMLKLPAIVAPRDLWVGPLLETAHTSGALAVGLVEDHLSIEVMSAPAHIEREKFRPDQPEVAVEILSSGTTGKPKRIAITHRQLQNTLEAAGAQKIRETPMGTPFIQFHSMGNISGFWNMLVPVMSGDKTILMEKFEVGPWVELLRRLKPLTGWLPAGGVGMLVNADVPRETFASMRSVRYGGATVDTNVHRRFEEKFGIPLLASYGATEFCGVVASLTEEDRQQFGDAVVGSSGRPWPGVNMRVIDSETGEQLASGEVGTLEVQPLRMGETWIRTNDLARIDQNGFLFIVGRVDGAINRGGFKILGEEIAEVLRKHPAVLEAVVIAAPDERLGEVPVAILKLRRGIEQPSDEALKSFCKQHLLVYKVPARFYFVDEFPCTNSYKIDLGALRARYATPKAPPVAAS